MTSQWKAVKKCMLERPNAVVLYILKCRMFSDISIMQSNKGRPIIVIDGYKFNKNQVSGRKIHWRCITYKRGCRAVLHTLEDMTIIKCYNVHNH